MANLNSIAYSGTIPQFYDSLLGPLYFQPYAEVVGKIIQSLSPHTVLELACGTGRLTHEIIDRLPNVELTATDINPSMLTHAQTSIGERKNIQWQIVDAVELPFEKESFDCVAVQFGVMFYSDKAKAYKAAHDVLKENGSFVFSAWNKLENNPIAAITQSVIEEFFPVDTPPFYHFPFRYHDEDVMMNELDSAGFRNISIELYALKGFAACAADAAKGLIEGTPAHTAIMERAPQLLLPLEKRIEEKLIARYGTGSFEPELEAFIVTAQK
jgi:ubiquinone/menaquinone biosynthesis C-methylase UbiE